MDRTNVVITDAIPNGAMFVEGSLTLDPIATLSTWSIDSTTPVLQVSSPSLAAGGAGVTVTFEVRVNPGTAGQHIANQAYVRSAGVPSIGSLPATTPGDGAVSPGLAVAKTGLDLDGAPLVVGDRISYTITITNYSAITHTNVVITDAIPTGTTYVPNSASLPGAILFPATQTLAVNIGPLAAFGSVQLEFAVTVDNVSQIGGNVAGVSSDNQNTQLAGPIYPAGGAAVGALEIAKTARDLNGGPLYPGDEILYTIAITNLLSTAQTNVVITDAIPAHTTYVPGSASVSLGSIASSNPVVANVGTLQPGQKATLTFRVRVNADAAGQIVQNSAQAGSSNQSPPVVTPPITTPGGGRVIARPILYIYLPLQMQYGD